MDIMKTIAIVLLLSASFHAQATDLSTPSDEEETVGEILRGARGAPDICDDFRYLAQTCDRLNGLSDAEILETGLTKAEMCIDKIRLGSKTTAELRLEQARLLRMSDRQILFERRLICAW